MSVAVGLRARIPAGIGMAFYAVVALSMLAVGYHTAIAPNVWFGNGEQIASERVGRETVTYVSNIYEYYVAYRLIENESERRAASKSVVKTKAVK
jgi:hypothetical protein